jgi:diaminopimelate decarboxylase
MPYNAGFMPGFSLHGAQLTCDGVPLSTIAAAVGTPAYVYSAAVVRDRVARFTTGFGSYPHAIHYALKANSNLAVVRVVRDAGGLVDANSGGEIEVAMRAGYAPADIVFTGVGKTPDELEQAVALGVKAINAESAGELDRIAAVARARQTTARVALRVNPDIAAGSHPHISTGLSAHKFGVPMSEARAIARRAGARAELSFVGVHVHVGSQLLGLEPLQQAAAAAVELASVLRDDGVVVEHLDLGGGLGIDYAGESVPTAERYAEALVEIVRPSGLAIVVEPGRAVVGAAGALLATVVDVKPQPGGKWFVVLDAGMSELLRPALYGAYHRIAPVQASDAEPVACDVVGPICESSDVFGVDRTLPMPSIGTVVAVLDTGAYGSAMSSNYNRHALPAEAMVDAGTWRLVRRRQTIADQLACEEG